MGPERGRGWSVVGLADLGSTAWPCSQNSCTGKTIYYNAMTLNN